MSRPDFGATPAAFRCARCGRLVDWAEAQLQPVCSCRPRLGLPPILVRQVAAHEAPDAMALLRRDCGPVAVTPPWGAPPLDECPILVAEMRGELAGALAYRLQPRALQVVALATMPMWQRSGVATELEAQAEFTARRHGVRRLVLSTTNDDLPSLYFYQRRGWTMADVVIGGALVHAADRQAAGFGGIPRRDEITLEKVLSD